MDKVHRGQGDVPVDEMLSDDYYEQESEDMDKVRRGHTDVAAEEMLSDDYYEQDGDETNDLLHQRAGNSSIRLNLNSNPKPRIVMTSKYVSRNSKASYNDGYDDDALYEDDNNEDEGDGNVV